jgi:Family of unknown function (DUF5977)
MLGKKIFFIAIVSGLVHNNVLGQAQDARIPKVVPPSPDAAALQKYGDIPISAYTGTPNISIPLYEIKSGNISIPISISYNASGIKVADESSRVGLGWVLNAGGVISRSVVGGDDFEFQTYSYNNQTTFEIPKAPRFDQAQNYNIKEGCNVTLSGYGINYTIPSNIFSDGGNYDLQPDQYSYNFNGHSGKFILRRNRDAVLNNKEKIDIKVLGSDATSWEIKTPDGVLYKFEQFETYVDYGGGGGPHKSSWYLTKIISATGRTVDFLYSSNSAYIHSAGSYFESKPGANLAANTSGSTVASPFTYYSAAVPGKWYTNLYLSKIVFDNGEVQFNYLSDRLDISGDVRLTNIQVYSKKQGEPVNQLIKTWTFSQSYFEGSNLGGGNNPNVSLENLSKRMKLSSLQETAGSSQLPSYQFFYNNESDQPSSLPAKISFSRDHWGYYNGKNNTSLIPSFVTGSSSDPIAFYLGTMGDQRDPDPGKNQLFILNKIKYPTGGFTQFEYETHDFDATNSEINNHSYFVNQTSVVSVPFGSSIYSNNVSGTYYSADFNFANMYGSAQTINMNVYFSVTSLPYSSIGVLNPITYSFEKTGSGSSGDAYLMSNVNATPPNPQIISSGSPPIISGLYLTVSFIITPGTYRFKVTLPANTQIYTIGVGGAYNAAVQNIPTVNNGEIVQNAGFGGGLRIKRITDYSDVSTISKLRKYNYHYQLNGNTYSYGRRMANPNYSYFSEMTGVANPDHLPDQTDIIATSNVLIRESDSNIPLNGSAGGCAVGYDKVEELMGENGENGKTIYEYQNQPDVIFNYTQFKQVLTQLTNIPRKPPFGGAVSNAGNGNLLKQTTYALKGNSYIPIRENVNIYQDAILAADNAAVLGIEKRPNGGSNLFVPENCYITNYVYPAITENRYLLTSATSKLYDITGATAPIVTTTEYAYDNNTHLQLTSKSEYKSNGDKITTSFKYPADYADAQSDPSILLMKGTAYMHALPVTQQLSLTKGTDQFLTEAEINKYQVINSRIFPKEKAILENTQPININTLPAAYNPASGVYPSGYVPRLFFDSYDASGNIIQVHKSDDVSMTYIWDYYYNYPVAEVTNAATATCAFTSFESDGTGNWIFTGLAANDASPFTGKRTYTLNGGSNNISKSGLDASKTYIISYWSKSVSATVNGSAGTAGINRLGWTYYEHVLPANTTSVTISGSVTIDELRLFPKGSLMTTYAYEPLIGITSQCDANNRIIYYDYDNFNRLVLIRDQDKNILKKICYNYAGQPENCNIFYNTPQSGTYTKQCSQGYTGSSVTYTIPANTYSSSIDVPAANAIALANVQANGQAYANANGTCTLIPPSCSFSMASGFSSPYNTISSTGNTVSFNLVFYPTNSAMNLYSTYTVATISTGCRPAATRTFSVNTSGRTFLVMIYSSGQVSVQLVYGSSVPVYYSVSLVGSYSIN